MDSVEVLREARAKIQGGWCQGAYRINGRFCVAGALRASVNPGYQALYMARWFLREAAGEPNLALWNDAPGRTKGDVLHLFDRAILLAEKREVAA